MSYFKIKNITNSLGKRHPRFNTTQVIGYKSLLGNNEVSILPGTEIIIESEFLPASAQQLRIKGFVIVQEIDKTTYLKSVKAREAEIVAEEASVKDVEPVKTQEVEDRSKKNKHKFK